MKFVAVAVAALSSIAAAGPRGEMQKCEPGTYSCTTEPHSSGWQVCDMQRQWVSAGHCPPQTVCKFNEKNKTPSCVPNDFRFP
ncbi:hypothetical protein HIM_01937 [Hirsutella minnesotensis 3608]|nr:hypothetical protein HIM_01937 [Hirsutella minnesotensis 3608]